jgi:cellulose synthase/poly-beta-1,6-N-acetylglucosamine synthase-like glycosyltransferase
MQASVVISYYKNIPNLELILLALNEQTAKGSFEVIVSEDAEEAATAAFINAVRPTLGFPLIHVTQEDKGFRKCKALNNAIQQTTTDFIIFLDGDCIPHKKLLEEYLKEKKEGRVLYGRRVMLSEKLSQQLLKTKDLKKLNLFNLVATGCERIEEGIYLPFPVGYVQKKKEALLLGCNMGLFKKQLLDINGFDEDYESSGGGEDTDIEWRLKAMGGVSFYSMKFKAIVYHLYHPVRFSMETMLRNKAVLDNKEAQGLFVCKNGTKKIQ